MKKVLIVIHGLHCGGAEKSLISFLNFFPGEKWSVDLLVANQHGMFIKEIPDYVNIINDEYALENYSTVLSQRRKKVCDLTDMYCQMKWQFAKRFSSTGGLSQGELKWKIWGKHIKPLKKHYDLAVSYMNGFPNYYVIDKVNADKKVLWIHNEFEKLGYSYNFEKRFYEKADKIVTISQACVDSILRVYPEFKDKTNVLENISSQTAINAMAVEKIEDEYFNYSGLRLLSVGRLNSQKGFDIAIKSAKILKDRGLKFLWYILGEGDLRANLTDLISEYNLENNVKLAGIKENPYPYIKNCDIFVQSSRFEGKSIVLDEAKILCKPCVVTKYVTAHNSIKSKINGLLVDIDEVSIADGICTLYQDEKMRKAFVEHLIENPAGNESEIEKYIALFEELLTGETE